MSELAVAENDPNAMLPEGRVRRPGGGRRPITETQPGALERLESLVSPLTRGDPESALRWTCKSLSKLATELRELGFQISPSKVGHLLRDLGYSLQADEKTREGASHPDRDEQFDYVNGLAQEYFAAGEPVISVDTKKKEIIGDYKNQGREREPSGHATPTCTHDFIDKAIGNAIPYGV